MLAKTRIPVDKKFPARLHVVLARKASTAIVFRRGPSKQVCTFEWDRMNDTFKLGQWMKGRIYERRTDLSPNGKYLIYFAMNGKWNSETRGAWTAISKAPWLKAIELHAKGDCWEGGGLFLSNKRFWLNDRYFTLSSRLFKSNKLEHDRAFVPDGQFGDEDTGVYYRRLIRDSWVLKKKTDVGKWNSRTIFEKELPKKWVLRKIAHEQVGSPSGKGCYWDEHELINNESKVEIKCSNWEWSDLDNKYLVWAEHGCLYRAKIETNKKIGAKKLLFDFNPIKFEELIAPY